MTDPAQPEHFDPGIQCRVEKCECLELCAKANACIAAPAQPVEATPRWVSVNTVDEMEAFYKAILPQIRTEAKYHGYAIGLHGSMRRDLDLIAVPWADDHSDKDELARAIQEAACGMPQMVYQWESKPCGRQSASIPVCWPEWRGGISDGHIDLSVMPDLDLERQLSLAQTENAGHIRIEDELKAELREAEKDAARLRDALRPFVRFWPNTVSTISLHVAEELLAKGYAYDVTRDIATKPKPSSR